MKNSLISDEKLAVMLGSGQYGKKLGPAVQANVELDLSGFG
jgi:hypothetical protein